MRRRACARGWRASARSAPASTSWSGSGRIRWSTGCACGSGAGCPDAMAGPLVSNSWYRVAALKPRLRSHARLHRHRYRGELWYLLQDPASGRVHRFTPAARTLIAAMDGRRTVEEIWELANRRLGERSPTQDQLIQLLGQLHGAD